MNNEQHSDLNSRSPEQLKELIITLRDENQKLRNERNAQAAEMEKHVENFLQLRERFATLNQQVKQIMERKKP